MISVNSAVAIVMGFATLALMIWVISVTEESRVIYRGPPLDQPATHADVEIRS